MTILEQDTPAQGRRGQSPAVMPGSRSWLPVLQAGPVWLSPTGPRVVVEGSGGDDGAGGSGHGGVAAGGPTATGGAGEDVEHLEGGIDDRGRSK